ncbi:uncharacterized protein LOC127860668 [Dreissena polymorpha]|uniref:Uncharacterized protein n=1 Tax=Dreissena polymorpha TaxID=45954 RepID=A0A9D4BPI1_DREPO|nr:uncharacterized protein LOC127860668 [Dreissena polymorpha]KAH3702588.1 hypothetical protein DPMN_077612 [Dreissena polymorpha]
MEVVVCRLCEGSKHALCVSNVMDLSTAKVSISQSSNAPSSELSTSVESDSMMTETKDSKHEFPAVGVCIGVSVGIVFIGVAIVAIVILRKRGVLRCKMNTNTDKPNVGEEREIDDEKKLDNPVDNHSCFILEIVPQSYETNADHF